MAGKRVAGVDRLRGSEALLDFAHTGSPGDGVFVVEGVFLYHIFNESRSLVSPSLTPIKDGPGRIFRFCSTSEEADRLSLLEREGDGPDQWEVCWMLSDPGFDRIAHKMAIEGLPVRHSGGSISAMGEDSMATSIAWDILRCAARDGVGGEEPHEAVIELMPDGTLAVAVVEEAVAKKRLELVGTHPITGIPAWARERYRETLKKLEHLQRKPPAPQGDEPWRWVGLTDPD